MSKWVVHCKNEDFDVYIGRPSRFGNPFSHKAGTKADYLVSAVETAIATETKDPWSHEKEMCDG